MGDSHRAGAGRLVISITSRLIKAPNRIFPPFLDGTIYLGKRTAWYASHVPEGHEAFCVLSRYKR